MTRFIYLLTLIFLIGGTSIELVAQSRNTLEQKRKDLITAIKKTNKALESTRQNKAKTLERFLALQAQIEQREALIQTLQLEIKLFNKNIVRNKDVVTALSNDLAQLQAEYSEMARAALRQKMQRNDLVFLFSAQGFNDFFQRWRYLQQYDEYRQRQVGLIAETQEMLQGKIVELEQQQIEKETVLATQQAQQNKINEELEVKNKLLKSLKKVEGKLAKDLAVQQRNRLKLNAAIEDVIRREVAASKRKARTPAAIQKRSERSTTSTSVGQGFSAFRGRLDWPVSNGNIVRRFGKQPHPKIKNLSITNNGIDIKTTANASVKSVFNGKIVSKRFIPGYKNMIIIQHRNFYTVYSNLEEVFVQRGEVVKRGQAIGKIDAVKREVHFEVWQGKTRLNPAQWIKNR